MQSRYDTDSLLDAAHIRGDRAARAEQHIAGECVGFSIGTVNCVSALRDRHAVSRHDHIGIPAFRLFFF